jgi:hypothetical protein
MMQDVKVKFNPELPRHEQGSFCQQTGFKFKEETSRILSWSIALYGAETWTLRK